MPSSPRPLRKLGFLTIGLFDEADPRRGPRVHAGDHRAGRAARLRQRVAAATGISSTASRPPVAVMAAASQRTSRIELGTAVIPLGWENPLRLAEDLATVDILSGGRINPGVSVGPPMHFEEVKGALYPDTADAEDFSYERVRRLLDFVRGKPASDFSGVQGFEVFSDRVQPHSAGLGRRLWYGGGSLSSAQWAGEHGMNFLTSSVVKAEGAEGPYDLRSDPALAPPCLPRRPPRTARTPGCPRGLVVIPTDSASPEQRAKYEAYAAKRTPRTTSPQGPAQLMFAPDIVGTSEEIAERLHAHAAFREVDEVAFRAAVHLRARGLCADPHRHGDETGSDAG
ncbi:alkanesulfonate monooxygenase SsuD/methylene tetrahydromethanopterin reductase-like flavin-dependent oxidoreductase (luciferase family), partial [Streptomyces canus]|nr:alkanesulfonate monooxygenase SsuD/methylene tetrahydromethanopterin reductase-like flavin-dependent oxidoreductase (luciferase family) [Streptomyces canus]